MSATWERLVVTTVGGRPLAVTRVLFAAAALVMFRSSSRRLESGLDPDRLHVAWPVLGEAFVGVPPTLVAVLWVGGALVALSGVAARVGAGSVALGMVIFYGADRQHYGNGAYLLLLVALLLVLADSGASRTPWGPDLRRAPWWPTFLLASQLSIVYGFAALQKLRRSSLRGDTIEWQLQGPALDHISWSWLPEALNVLGGGAEAFCAIGLWFAATRRAAVLVGVTLHLGILVFIRASPDLLAFGLVSFALYPAFWSAAPPLGAAFRRWRDRGSAATSARSSRPVAGP